MHWRQKELMHRLGQAWKFPGLSFPILDECWEERKDVCGEQEEGECQAHSAKAQRWGSEDGRGVRTWCTPGLHSHGRPDHCGSVIRGPLNSLGCEV